MIKRRGLVLTLLILATSACASACSAGGDEPTAPRPAPAPWEVGSCVYQSSGPSAIPTNANQAQRDVLRAQQVFEAIACTDTRAFAKITAMGVKVDPLGTTPADTGCPDDTDAIYRTRGSVESRLACTRNLNPPHPGDPGGGGGVKILAGDCVWASVGASTNPNPIPTNVAELPCAGPDGYFAKVLARADAGGDCTADGMISRMVAVDGSVVCLGQGDAGTIAAVGDCLNQRQDEQLPAMRTPCGAETDTVTGFATRRADCPGGVGRLSLGYHQAICTRRA